LIQGKEINEKGANMILKRWKTQSLDKFTKQDVSKNQLTLGFPSACICRAGAWHCFTSRISL
jgi:hypothetical protein